MKHLLLSLSFLLVFPLLASAQTEPVGPPVPPSTAWQERFFKSPETVLPVLYAAAISHSAAIDKLEMAKQVASDDIQLSKKKILNSFGINSSYNYGTLPYFATDGGTERVRQVNAFALDARAQYNVGVNVVLPIEVLANRRTLLHRQELLLREAAAGRAVGEEQIRRQVIVLYQELVLAQANLQHYQNAVQSASISKKLAESKFKAGEIQVDEQMAATEFYGKAVLAQEEARNKYQTAMLLMEDMLGSPLHLLMNGK